MDWTQELRQSKAGIAAGANVRQARKDRADHGTRSAAEVRALREQAARDASLCADCFSPIGPHDSITRVMRWAVHIPAFRDAFGLHKARDEFIPVPICLSCWLIGLERDARDRPANRHWLEERRVEDIERFRYEGCGRPMRVHRDFGRRQWRQPLHHSERVCSAVCLKIAANQRARERRRVEHEPRRCAVCKVLFVPTRSDAVTCSNVCRQKLFRQRHCQRRKRV